MKKSISVIGHRGIAASFPENTILSFEKAIEVGVDAIEFDVHLTRDRRLVVTHDHDIDRCCNGHGKVGSFTLAELKAFDFGSWKGPEFAGIRIPTLEETLDAVFAKKPGFYLLVELKDDIDDCTRMVIDTLRRYGMIGHCLVLSFHARQLKLARQLEPDLTLQGFPDRYRKDDCADLYDFIDKICLWNKDANEPEISACHARNIAVDIYPVDNAEQLDHVIGLDIDSVTTNAAYTLLPLLRERGMR